MKNEININQLLAVKLDLNKKVDALDLILLDFLKDYFWVSPVRIIKNNKEYAGYNYKDYINSMPAFPLSSNEFEKRIIHLAELRLIELLVMIDNRKYYRIHSNSIML